MGLVRNIGTSNMTIPKLELLLRDASIKPACNEMELHPHFQQPELFDYVASTASCPSATARSARRAGPERDRTPDDTVDIEDPVHRLHRQGARGASGARLHQMGRPARPNSDPDVGQPAQLHRQSAARPSRIRSHRRRWRRSRRSTAIAASSKARFSSGKGQRGWEDLWDLDGVIAQ